MRREGAWLVMVALLAGGCSSKKHFDKTVTCERIRDRAASKVAKEQWMTVCSLAEDQLVKCMGGEASAADCAMYQKPAPGAAKRQALVAVLDDFADSPVPVVRKPADAGVDAGPVGSDADHELWQAAVTSGDPELMKRVNSRLGLADDKGVPSERMKGFAATHAAWSTQHADFVNGLVDAAKARAFVEDHTK